MHARGGEKVATGNYTGVGEAGDEELEEGELPSDEDEIEIDASSELTVQPAPEIEQDEEDFSDHQVGAQQLHLNDDSCVFLVRCVMLSVTLSCRL